MFAMTEELAQQGGQRRVAIGQPAGPFQFIEFGDEMARHRSVKRTQSVSARLGAPITLILRLVLKVASLGHSEADKRPIPPPTINKGERARPCPPQISNLIVSRIAPEHLADQVQGVAQV